MNEVKGLIPPHCTIEKAGSTLLEWYSEHGLYSRADSIRLWLDERTISRLKQRAEAADGLLREVPEPLCYQSEGPSYVCAFCQADMMLHEIDEERPFQHGKNCLWRRIKAHLKPEGGS